MAIEAHFDKGKHTLTSEQARLLRAFVPEVLAVARDELGRKWLKRVVVEGFASPEGDYLYNLNLSLQRSQRVLCVLLAQPYPGERAMSQSELEQIRDLFLVGGYSFNAAKFNAITASYDESRRVELRLEFLGIGEFPSIDRSRAARRLRAMCVGGIMSSLSRLRAALHEAASGSLRGLTFDTNPLDRETTKMRDWLGDRGSAKPPQDVIVAALRAFFQLQELQGYRQALLVCFGCLDPVLPTEATLIEDGDRFPRLLDGLEAYLPNPRAFRRCYRGLLNAYFGYDFETARFAGKDNWRRLRTYLRDRAANTVASGLQPGWVEGLQANLQLLGNDPGGFYGQALLTGRSEEFESARGARYP